MQRTIVTCSTEETEALGAALVRRADHGGVFALYGELGAGKTALVRGAAVQLGEFAISSPTFSILHHYETDTPLYHFDLYRLSGSEDLEAVGFYEVLDHPGFVFIEWPDRAGASLPEQRVEIRIDVMQEDQRKITINDPFDLLDWMIAFPL